jgi:hypothetical protein
MRSAAEIRFRLRQEFANLKLAAFPPSIASDAQTIAPLLPPAETIAARLRGSRCEAEIKELAHRILQGQVPLLGTCVDVSAGREVSWRRDPVRGIESPPLYFRRIPYLDVKRAGDHKLIWELNRHQHLALLAQAFALHPDAALLAHIQQQLESWTKANPFQRGINWTSALEAAFRALSWIWIFHLTGEHMTTPFRRLVLTGLYQHAKHLEYNLSIYFSPNTHLLGEAVALHALGVLFPSFPEARRWREIGSEVVEQQLVAQVQEDGSHFEQSSYYHVYTLDMFLFHGLLSGMSEAYRSKLTQMAEYLDALHSPSGELPFLGDDDGGRFFYPYGPRNQFGRATLATCSIVLNRPEWLRDAADLEQQAAWWLTSLPQPQAAVPRRNIASRLFANAGVAVMRAAETHIVCDAGPFGPGSGGHSHSDTLSVIVNDSSERILIDPGAYTYVGDPQWRERFRGTAAHNTLRIDGINQARPTGPFRWLEKPEVKVNRWQTDSRHDALDADCRYRGFRHRRRCLFVKPHCLLILDEVEGPAGEHLVEQFWHPGEHCEALPDGTFAIGARATLALSLRHATLSCGGEFGWISAALEEKHEAPVICATYRGVLPVRIAAALDLSGQWRIAPPESGKLFLEQLRFGPEFE